jgi:hypothetical protein
MKISTPFFGFFDDVRHKKFDRCNFTVTEVRNTPFFKKDVFQVRFGSISDVYGTGIKTYITKYTILFRQLSFEGIKNGFLLFYR